ncbi:MAG: peptidoglycan-binding domain-containing protein [Patescibacteria group bacterium]|nr:peptidoglycan-binding domain-containing protein [Patescibacteria group bacterium]
MTKKSSLLFGFVRNITQTILILASVGLLVVALPGRLHAEDGAVLIGDTIRPLAISAEFSGSPVEENHNTGENVFTTTGSSTDDIGENIFTTATADDDRPLAISEEFGGSTTGDDGGENTFTTLANGGSDDDPEDCVSGCGGGSGGGPIHRRPDPKPVDLPAPCVPYLLDFIKLGRDNDRIEVLKLQSFLRTFEGLEVPLSGVYDQVTYEAVKVFQSRYSNDVLGPWGIGESTGYVFITTRLAINNIYCSRTTANNLNLRNFYPSYGEYQDLDEGVIKETETNLEDIDLPVVPIDLMGQAGPGEGVPIRNFFQAAALGFLDWLDFSHFLNLVFLLIVILVLWWVIKLKQEINEVEQDKFNTGRPIPPIELPAASTEDEPDEMEEGVLKDLDNSEGDEWLGDEIGDQLPLGDPDDSDLPLGPVEDSELDNKQ